MLDPKLIRDQPEKIKKMLQDRQVEFDFDKMLELDRKRRDLIKETDELRKKRNQMSVKIGEAKKSNNDASELLKQMGEISKNLDNLESAQKQVEIDFEKLAYSIPNMLHQSVPVGDDSSNVIIREWGKIPEFDFF